MSTHARYVPWPLGSFNGSDNSGKPFHFTTLLFKFLAISDWPMSIPVSRIATLTGFWRFRLTFISSRTFSKWPYHSSANLTLVLVRRGSLINYLFAPSSLCRFASGNIRSSIYKTMPFNFLQPKIALSRCRKVNFEYVIKEGRRDTPGSSAQPCLCCRFLQSWLQWIFLIVHKLKWSSTWSPSRFGGGRLHISKWK